MTAKHRSDRPPRTRGTGSVYQRADGRWEGKVYVGTYPATGAARYRKVTASTRPEVVRRLDQLRDELHSGAAERDGNLTVGQWLDEWLAELPRSVAAGTVVNYRNVVERYVRPALGSRRLAKLRARDVANMLNDLEAAGYAANTVRLARSVLRRSLRKAQERELVAQNVAALVDGPKVASSQERGRTLTPEQAQALLAAAADRRLGVAVLVGLITGLRPGELLGLRWRDVDLEGATINVAGALKRLDGVLAWEPHPKTMRSRRRIGAPDLVDDLRDHKRRQAAERIKLGPEWGRNGWAEVGLVFTTVVGTPIDHANYRHHLGRLCAQAGLGHWHPHELRHSAASLAIAGGADLKVVSELLGHSSIRITADVYGHLFDGATATATSAVAALVRPARKPNA